MSSKVMLIFRDPSGNILIQYTNSSSVCANQSVFPSTQINGMETSQEAALRCGIEQMGIPLDIDEFRHCGKFQLQDGTDILVMLYNMGKEKSYIPGPNHHQDHIDRSVTMSGHEWVSAWQKPDSAIQMGETRKPASQLTMKALSLLRHLLPMKSVAITQMFPHPFGFHTMPGMQAMVAFPGMAAMHGMHGMPGTPMIPAMLGSHAAQAAPMQGNRGHPTMEAGDQGGLYGNTIFGDF